MEEQTVIVEELEKKPGAAHQKPPEKKRKKTLLIILLILVLIAAIAAAFFLFRTPEEEPEGPAFAVNASVGPLPSKTEEEIKAMLDQQITEKTVAFTVNAQPVFETGTSEGNLMLESPANNINYIEFVIRRDDTGDTIYKSGLLKPNEYIEYDKLLVDLDKGTYACTVDITLYDPETLEAKGMTQAGITLTVKN